MDPSDNFPTGKFSRKELQGPRPTPLKIHKDSHKIRKPPVAPPQPSQPPIQPPRQPVIIYDISPKVIHTNPSNFMNLVQRLTGLSSVSEVATATKSTRTTSTFTATATANPNFYDSQIVSPAARYATIEKAARSPQGMKSLIFDKNGNIDRDHQYASGLDLGLEMDQYLGAVEMNSKGLFAGILSPGPASLPPIPQTFFSPVSDGFFHDLSPVLHGNKNNFIEGSTFMPSPAASYFVSPRIASPNTPSIDLLFHNIFSDYN